MDTSRTGVSPREHDSNLKPLKPGEQARPDVESVGGGKQKNTTSANDTTREGKPSKKN